MTFNGYSNVLRFSVQKITAYSVNKTIHYIQINIVFATLNVCSTSLKVSQGRNKENEKVDMLRMIFM